MLDAPVETEQIDEGSDGGGNDAVATPAAPPPMSRAEQVVVDTLRERIREMGDSDVIQTFLSDGSPERFARAKGTCVSADSSFGWTQT